MYTFQLFALIAVSAFGLTEVEQCQADIYEKGTMWDQSCKELCAYYGEDEDGKKLCSNEGMSNLLSCVLNFHPRQCTDEVPPTTTEAPTTTELTTSTTTECTWGLEDWNACAAKCSHDVHSEEELMKVADCQLDCIKEKCPAN